MSAEAGAAAVALSSAAPSAAAAAAAVLAALVAAASATVVAALVGPLPAAAAAGRGPRWRVQAGTGWRVQAGTGAAAATAALPHPGWRHRLLAAGCRSCVLRCSPAIRLQRHSRQHCRESILGDRIHRPVLEVPAILPFLRVPLLLPSYAFLDQNGYGGRGRGRGTGGGRGGEGGEGEGGGEGESGNRWIDKANSRW